MVDEKLDLIIKKNEDFKKNTDLIIKKNIDYDLSNFRKILPKKFLTDELEIEINKEVDKKDYDLSNFRKILPKKFLTDELEIEINKEVDKKVSEFSVDIDLSPVELYYSLKNAEVKGDGENSETELINLAYDYLEKNTKNKFFKKILKELKKENE